VAAPPALPSTYHVITSTVIIIALSKKEAVIQFQLFLKAHLSAPSVYYVYDVLMNIGCKLFDKSVSQSSVEDIFELID
jgi:hypothetical protein